MPHIRPAVLRDGSRIAYLSGELGYSVTDAEMQDRLSRMLSSPAHALLVADMNDAVVGWISGEIRLSIEAGARAEITGLIVDAAARKGGIGRALVAGIERWALAHHMGVILVRSNVTRVESHPFYERLGYSQVKTQHSYRRALHAV